MRIKSILLLGTLVAILSSGCSTFTVVKHTQSRESRAKMAERIELAQRDSTEVVEQKIDTIVVDSAVVVAPLAEQQKIDSVESQRVVAPIESEIIEHSEIPQFTTSQSAHVMISEFKDIALFEDKMLSYEELSRDFVYPVGGHITSDFGWRGSRMHWGIDIKAYYKEPIKASFDGVVRVAMYNGAYGNCVVVRHYNGLETLYAHATKIVVNVNDKVKAGDTIALAGKSGRATGVHLHYEVRVMGQYIDPNLILNTKERTLNGKNLYLSMRGGKIYGSNTEDAEEREQEIKEATMKRYHVVKSGDVLSRIAINNKTTVSAICKLNNIKPTTILRIGQRLRVK